MKKIVFMIALVAGFMTTQAQRATLMPNTVRTRAGGTANSAGDTVITSGTMDTVNKTITVTAGYTALGIQVIGTKVSGTITAKAYLYSSLDGVAYNLTDSAAVFANSAGAQSVWFTKTAGLPYVYYRIQVRNVGGATSTESLAIKVYFVARKAD